MMSKCCTTCRNRFALTKFDYSHGGCEHTKMDGFICMAFAAEGDAVWMVGLNEDGLCECYERKDNAVDG